MRLLTLLWLISASFARISVPGEKVDKKTLTSLGIKTLEWQQENQGQLTLSSQQTVTQPIYKKPGYEIQHDLQHIIATEQQNNLEDFDQYVQSNSDLVEVSESFYQCPKDETGQLPYALSCSQFLNCWKGRGFIQNCAPGTLFNARTFECDFASKVKCHSQSKSEAYTMDNLVDLKLKTGCPKGFSGVVPHHHDCSKFINCDHGKEMVMDCAPGTLFNLKINSCDYPHNAECASWSNQFGQIVDQSQDGSNKVYVESKKEARCPSGAVGLLPHPSDCSKFLNCANGQTFVQDCGPGTHFNPETQVCDFPYNVNCKNDEDYGGKFDVRVQPELQCPLYAEGVFPHPKICSKYVNCHQGQADIKECPQGLVYDVVSNGCDHVFNVDCKRKNVKSIWDQNLNQGGWNQETNQQGSATWNQPQTQQGTNWNQNQDQWSQQSGGNWNQGGTSGINWNSQNLNQEQIQQGSANWNQGTSWNQQTTPKQPATNWNQQGGTSWNQGQYGGNQQTTQKQPPTNWNSQNPNQGQIQQGSANWNQGTTWNQQTTPKQPATNWNQQGSASWNQQTTPKQPPTNWNSQNLNQEQIQQGSTNWNQGASWNQQTTPKQQTIYGEIQRTTQKSPATNWNLQGINWNDKNFKQEPSGNNWNQGQYGGSTNWNQQETGWGNKNVNQASGNQGQYGTNWNVQSSNWNDKNLNEEQSSKWNQESSSNWHQQTNNQIGGGTNWDQKTSWHDNENQNHDLDQNWSESQIVANIITNKQPVKGEKPTASMKYNDLCSIRDFYCTPSSCIPRSMHCDGTKDCPSGIDELNCDKILNEFTLNPNHILAVREKEKFFNITVLKCAKACLESNSFQCRSFSYRKDDGVCFLSDVNLGSSGSLILSYPYDYYELTALTMNCSNLHKCPNLKCISHKQICDGVNDCGDRSDEKGCSAQAFGYEIKLAGSENKHEGRIEIKAFGQTGYVCDDRFGLRNAEIVCKEVGFPLGAIEVKGNSFYAQDVKDKKPLYMMDDVTCLGNETSIRDCDFNGWGVSNCEPQEIVGVVCKTPQETCPKDHWKCDSVSECVPLTFLCDGVYDCTDESDEATQHCDAPIAVRLVGGANKYEGRVEVRHYGIWGTVCDDDFNDDAAKVICKYLGYIGKATVKRDGGFGPGTGPIWLDQVYCQGNESALQHCAHWNWGEHNCEHAEDVGVVCSNNETPVVESERNSRVDNIPERVFVEQCGLRKDAMFLENDEVHFRVVGGAIANRGDYPWQASLRIKNQGQMTHWCGAVVITKKFILTAAHCLQGFSKGAYTVVAGDYNTDEDEKTEQEAYIEDFYIHEQFRVGQKMNNDIALIKLKGAGFTFTRDVQPICLPSANVPYLTGDNCTISGFGSIQSGKSSYSHDMRAAYIPLIAQDVCKMPHVYGNTITEGMVCAGSLDEGADACEGDSGGPLACLYNGYYTLFGLTSWGHHCGYANKPGVYVRVAHYRKWIDDMIFKHI